MTRGFARGPAVIAVAAVLAACGGTDDADPAASPATEAPEPATTVAELAAEPERELDVEPASESEPEPEPEEAPDTASEAPALGPNEIGDQISVFDLAIGDCYLGVYDPESDELGSRAGCQVTGADQVTDIVVLDDGPYPGDAAFDEAGAACGSEVEDPIGDVTARYDPTEDDWADGARRLICVSYRSADFDDDGLPLPPLVVGTSCFLADPEGVEAVGAPVDCSEPHEGEFVGRVPSPVEVLPDDFDEAATLVSAACGPLVEEVAGRSPSVPGIIVGFNIPGAELGQPVESEVECYAIGSGTDLLVGTVTDLGAERAYGDGRIIADLEPGTCFTFLGDSFDIGVVGGCDVPDALMFIGSFVADAGPFPGDDALRAIRSERCREVLEEGPRLPVLLDSISGTIPDERAWTAHDMRTVTCDGMLP